MGEEKRGGGSKGGSRPFLGTSRARHRLVKILDEVRARHGFQLIEVRGYAGTRSSARQRPQEGEPLESFTGAKAESVPSLAQGVGKVVVRTAIDSVRLIFNGQPGVLAATLL